MRLQRTLTTTTERRQVDRRVLKTMERWVDQLQQALGGYDPAGEATVVAGWVAAGWVAAGEGAAGSSQNEAACGLSQCYQ